MIELIDKTNSAQGREIPLYGMFSSKAQKRVLIIGVFHGDEPQGEFLINRFLAENRCTSEFKNNLLILPCLNPDGKYLNTRQNSNGIDINRNFPTNNYKLVNDSHYYGGKVAGSEIETQFIMKILEDYPPNYILSLHAPYRVVNYDGPAKEIAEKISEITGYPVEEDIGYETPGSFGTYAGKERQIPTITLELPEDKSNEDLWNEVKDIFYFCANISV